MTEINTVIKHTQSIAEYKAVRADMLKRTEQYSTQHMQAVSNWEYGNPIKCWLSGDNDLCIEYASGQWWHYRETAEGLQWW